MEWAERIETMTAGYRDSCILIAALKAGIFEALGDGRRTPAEVAADRNLDTRAVDVVMCALAATGILLKEDGDRFTIDPGARPFLLAGGPETMVSIIGHNRSMLRSWVQLEEVMWTGAPAPRQERSAEEMEDFIRGMENVSRRSSEEVASKIDFSGARRLLDLGGGPGTAALTFARANPELKCVVFDLEGPEGIAAEQIRRADLTDRVTTQAGDFLTDEIGQDFDIVYISNIIHMLSPDQTLELLIKATGALAPGGRVLVKDFFLEDSRTGPPFAAQFSVNMLVVTRGGRSYTRGEMDRMFSEAGLVVAKTWLVATHSLVLEARRESPEAGGV
jgi:cyclopropane fatty-acyl-phospholipid synthase-like methyltransferase